MRPISLAILLTSLLPGADPTRTLDSGLIQRRFLTLRLNNEDRLDEVRNLFAEAGCTPREEKILSSKLPNLICVLPGTSKQTVVVTAHFDQRGAGEGAIDNWSGAALLPSLFESLSGSPHRLTFEFVAFTDEERGLIGSRDFVGHLTKDHRAAILLNVNIDSIGLAGPIRAAIERTDHFLLTCAAIVADDVKVGLGADTIGDRYDSDAGAFKAWRIPTIDVHSLTKDKLAMLHSKQDVRGALDPNSYYKHYRFLTAYLAYLDNNVEANRPVRTGY